MVAVMKDGIANTIGSPPPAPWWTEFPSPLDYAQEPTCVGALIRSIPPESRIDFAEWVKLNPSWNPWTKLLEYPAIDDDARAILTAGASHFDVWFIFARLITGAGSIRRNFYRKILHGNATKRDWIRLFVHMDSPLGQNVIDSVLPQHLTAAREEAWRDFRAHKARQGNRPRKPWLTELPKLPHLLARHWLSTYPAPLGVPPFGFAFMSDEAIASVLTYWGPPDNGEVWDGNTVKVCIFRLGLKRAVPFIKEVIADHKHHDWKMFDHAGERIHPRPRTGT